MAAWRVATAAGFKLLLAAALLASAPAGSQAQNINVVPSLTVVMRGTASGLADSTAYKALALEFVNGGWWTRPSGSQGSPLSATGRFVLSFPMDAANLVSRPFAVYIVPSSFVAPVVQGAPQPPSAITAAAVQTTTLTFPPAGAGGGGTGGGGTVPPPPTPTPVPGAGRGTLTITTTPAQGTGAAIAGRLSGVTPLTGYQVAVFVADAQGALWGPKTTVAVAADGGFAVTGWATDPNDLTATSVTLAAVPVGFTVPRVLGAALPAELTAAAAATRGVTLGAAPPAPSPPAGGGGTATGTITVAAPPATGTGDAVTGRVTGLANPTGYQVTIFVADAQGALWGPKAAAALGGDGGFSISGWATNPNDLNANSVTLVVVPAGFTVPMVLGAALPADVTAAAAATRAVTLAGAPPAPAPAPAPGGAPAAGEFPWPPTATPGQKRGPANGRIAWSGYNWVVKDSRGGAVGPGPNVFVGTADWVWTDSWGLHQRVAPRQGCGSWASSEVWLDRALGYGVYLMRGVGPIETLDPQVTWSPLFLWDDSGNSGNGWREIDFEFARWGNAGDPTSSQFVLMPLRTGGLAPGWRVRYRTSGGRMATFGGTGAGGGPCNNMAADSFNGAAVSKFTHVLRWFPNTIQWATYDGLFALNNIQAARPKLVASYTYGGGAQWIPTPGDNRVHMNTWSANAGAPAYGRTVHTILHGFEYSRNDINLGIPANSNI